MKKHTTALLIEDFPILAKVYREVLLNHYDQVHIATTNGEAARRILSRPTDRPYDLAVIHDLIRDQENERNRDGLALAIELREKHPSTKLFYSINRLSTYLVGSIIREVNPDALIYRPDLNATDFERTISRIKSGQAFYSPSVVPHMRYDIAGSKVLDRIDRNILHYLGQGARTKDLPRLISLSLPSIEKRKKQMKNLLNHPENDYQLIQMARHSGLI